MTTLLSKCPISHQFDPLDLTDPFPLLARARVEEPIFYSADIGYWVVTRYGSNCMSSGIFVRPRSH